MDRSLLNKATAPDEHPVTGIELTELAKMTFAAFEVPEQMVEYLVNKLKKDHPYVKQKTLRIIRHVSEHGKVDFRRGMIRNASAVKENMGYRGKPDPLRGDAPNKAVRDEAEQAVKAIFSEAGTNAWGQAAQPPPPKMQGFGSQEQQAAAFGGMQAPPAPPSYGGLPGPPGAAPGISLPPSANGGGAGGSSYGGRRMEGFGNPAFENRPANNSSGGGFGGETGNPTIDKANEVIKRGVDASVEYLKFGASKAAEYLPDNVKANIPTSVLKRMQGGGSGGLAETGYAPHGYQNHDDPRNNAGGYLAPSSNMTGYHTAAQPSSGSNSAPWASSQTTGSGFAAPGGSYNPAAPAPPPPAGTAASAPWGSATPSSTSTSYPVTAAAAHGAPSIPSPGSAQPNGGIYEQQLVADLCAPGGARVAPASDVLEDFLRKCESLHAEAVADNLRTMLRDGTWQQKAKVLYAIEACCERQLDAITGDLVEKGSAGLIEACCEIPQCRAKAQKVLGQLGLSGGQHSGSYDTKSSSPGSTTAPPEVDLLDMGGTSENFASTVSSSGAGGNDVDLLGDLMGSGPAGASSGPPRPPPASSTGADLLLDTSGPPMPTAVPQQPAVSSSPPKKSGGGLFGNLNVKQTPAAAGGDAPLKLLGGGEPSSGGPPTSSAMDDLLSLGGGPGIGISMSGGAYAAPGSVSTSNGGLLTPAPEQPAAPASGGGSAFSFMNRGSPLLQPAPIANGGGAGGDHLQLHGAATTTIPKAAVPEKSKDPFSTLLSDTLADL